MEIRSAVPVLSALAHEGRLAVFRLLVTSGAGGVAAGDIARHLGVPANTMSAHLTILGHAGLVLSRRVSRSIIYTADYKHMAALLSFLVQDCCNGSPEVCAPLAEIVSTAARRTIDLPETEHEPT